ncbi:MAG: hypothetical protein V5A84_04370 [Planctomycetota bacterium]
MLAVARMVLVGAALGGFVGLPMADGAGGEEEDAEPEPLLVPGDRSLLDSAASAGTWDGEFGIQFRGEEHEDDEFVVDGEPEDSASAGWAYLDLSWLSKPVYDTRVGVGGLGITEVWKDKGFDKDNDIFYDGGTFSDPVTLTQAYLRHDLSPETYVVAGRAADDLFGEPPTGDGDYYQGVGLTTGFIPRVTLRAHAVNEWIDDASPSWDFGGMDESWAEMKEGSPEVGEDVGADTGSAFGSVAYTAMAEVEVVRELLTVTPYVQHHSDVATSLGAGFQAEHPVNDVLTLGANGAWVTHLEDTPDELWPHDEDFQQRLIRGYGKAKGVELGVGYYSISNDRIIFNGPAGSGQFERDFKDVFIMDELDPLEEDIGKYGDQQGSRTIFADVGYSWGPVSTKVIYGVADRALANAGGVETDEGAGSELNVKVGVDITDNLGGELFYAQVQDDFAGDGEQGYDMIGGALFYSF